MDADRLQREKLIATIGERQHGVIGHRELVAIGITRDSIRRRLESGRLHRVHSGVYAVGHRRLTMRGRWMAGVLACAEGTLLSNGDAAALWDLLPVKGSRIHVTVPARGAHPRRGLIVHATLSLPPADR